jgi:uncharacterized protein (TIGR03546 family)
MFSLKLLAKILQVLKEGATPRQIAGGFVLGFALGLIPGWPVQAFLLLLLIVLLNVNLTIAGAGAVLASLGAWIADPVLDRVGGWVLEDIGPLRGLWTALFNWPPMALTRFNNTVMMGSLVIGVIGAAVFFPVWVWAVKQYRERFLAWAGKLWIMRFVTGSRLFGWVARAASVGVKP